MKRILLFVPLLPVAPSPLDGGCARYIACAQPGERHNRANRTVIFDCRMIIGVTRAAATSGIFKYRKYLCLEPTCKHAGGFYL